MDHAAAAPAFPPVVGSSLPDPTLADGADTPTAPEPQEIAPDPHEVFAQAVARHYEHLARFAFALTGDRSAAEHAVVEGCARVWPRFRRGDVGRLAPHLWRAVIREIERRERPRRRTRERSSGPDGPSESARPPSRWRGAAPDEQMWVALLELPIDLRTALVLRYVEDLTADAAATLLGISVELVESRIERGVAQLGARIEATPATPLRRGSEPARVATTT